GTSAAKLLLVRHDGEILNTVTREYSLSFPHPGWSEQAPEDWWQACLDGIPALLRGFDASQVAAIGAGGQMHGLVVLDAEDRVIRPAILWNDGRTDEETAWLNGAVGKDKLSALTANIAFAGFTAPKLLWLRKHEPEHFSRIAKMMLPKDYVNYLLTGVHASDYSDASGTLLLNVAEKRWSEEMLSLCGVSQEQMPCLFESYEVIGLVKDEIADRLGLPHGVKVVAGAGDNAAAAIGTGTIGAGGCNISLGTSGTLFISSASFSVDPRNSLHAFCHADGRWHLMGCMLSAASCNKWFNEEILHTSDFAAEQDGIEARLGENHVFFLPYLMGERSPLNDTDVRGTFTGLSLNTTRRDLVQAVLEGVAFGIRDCFEVAKAIGISVKSSKLCGGGAKSPVWRTMLANILGIPLELPQTEQGPGMGGAMLAMVGAGAYRSVEEVCAKLVRVKETVSPDPVLTAKYEEKYRKFSTIYPALRALYQEGLAR
ncbi:MAG: xylulokinase, partial [bacterium]